MYVLLSCKLTRSAPRVHGGASARCGKSKRPEERDHCHPVLRFTTPLAYLGVHCDHHTRGLSGLDYAMLIQRKC